MLKVVNDIGLAFILNTIMTEYLRSSKSRTDTFGSLHAENIPGNSFMKEESDLFTSGTFTMPCSSSLFLF